MTGPFATLDDEAHRRAAVLRAGLVLPEAARVQRLDEMDRRVLHDRGAADVHAFGVRGADQRGELERRDHLGAGLLRELRGVAHVVGVPVRDEDGVERLRLLDLRRHRIVQPRIDRDRRAAGRLDDPGRVSPPRRGRRCRRRGAAGAAAAFPERPAGHARLVGDHRRRCAARGAAAAARPRGRGLLVGHRELDVGARGGQSTSATETSRGTHTIDERFMTSSFHDVGRLTNFIPLHGLKARQFSRWRGFTLLHNPRRDRRLTSAHASINSMPDTNRAHGTRDHPRQTSRSWPI